MEWVETTGPTIAAALDAALDELGVDEEDVEFEVLQEPKAGLFGRLGAQPARIRARVKPISREKPGERARGRRGPRRTDGSKGTAEATPAGRVSTVTATAPREGPEGEATSAQNAGEAAEGPARRRRRRGRGKGQRVDEGSDVSTEEIPIGEQADVADEFLRGLLEAFGVRAEVAVRIEEDAVLVDVEGRDLGVLVGPKGTTLRAIEDLVRTVVQRRTDGHGARIHVDIGGYQAKRRAALEQFAGDLARRVLETGKEIALEPMSPADRKIVHDTVAAIEGVTTISEGEEPRRRVVIRPA